MNLALFDFDGTITTEDTFSRFLRHAASPPRLALGRALLAPLVLGYRAGWVSMRTMRASAAWVALCGTDEASVRALGERYARDVLPGLVRPEARERLDWHRAQGDEIVVVSASIDPYLEPWCRAQGLQLICNRVHAIDGRLTGRMREPDCGGEEKSRRVRARYDVAGYPLGYA